MINQNIDSVMVCLSPSPSNMYVIKVASTMLKSNKDRFYALYVSDAKRNLSEFNQRQLEKNISYAKQKGAEIEIVSSDDIAYEILTFANVYKVTKLVIGKNMNTRLNFFHKPIYQHLLDNIDDLNLTIVPVKENRIINTLNKRNKITINSIMISMLILFICTIIGFVFFRMGFHDSNIIMIYLLGVLCIALWTSNIICSVISSIVSVVLFNFYFTMPILSLSFYDSAYLMTFVIMIIVAFLISTLTHKIQLTAASYANMANVSRILLETNQLLQKKQSMEDIFDCGCRQLTSLFNRDIAYFPLKEDSLQQPVLFPVQVNSHCEEFLNSNEISVATWVAMNGRHAGATTRYLSGSKGIYYAVLTEDKIYGVIGIYLDKDVLESFDKRILLAILSEMAICLENIKNNEEKNDAIITAKKEQLRSDLLRSISHDLRTPLTSIYGNADVLLNDHGNLACDTKNVLYKNIYDDSLWLINLVENLLSITRIEDGKVKLRIEPEIIEEVTNEALNHVSKSKDNHKIEVHISDDFLMADMDARLIVQVLINLVNNAIKYTEPDSLISINAYQLGDYVYVEVCDNGDGIDNEDKEKIFEKFYTVNHSVLDSKKSMGLGLSLCKSIIEAHRGTISVRDNCPKGSIFTFSLPATKVTINKNIIVE